MFQSNDSIGCHGFPITFVPNPECPAYGAQDLDVSKDGLPPDFC